MSTVEKLLDRLSGVKRTAPNRWMAKCPAHDDRTASLGVKEGDGGKIICHCFAGCATGDVLAAVGLSFVDLYPERTAREYDPTKPQSRPPRFSASELLKTALFETTVIRVAMAKLMSSGVLGDGDVDRVDQAMETLDNIRREVMS